VHQTQWVRAQAGSLDEALTLVRAHVEALGDVDNWWRWTLARLPDGEVRVRALEDYEKEDLSPEELAEHTAWAQEAPATWRPTERWTSGAWGEAWTQLGLQGLQPVRLGALSERDRKTLAELARTPVTSLPRRFLDTALASLKKSYGGLDLDVEPRFASMTSRARADRARAFERVYQLLADEHADAGHLPFLRDEAPYQWPAHLLGDREDAQVFHLALDMHL
jgi:hypothetical protein